MQTREPRKRVNWIFVVILIIVIPLALLVLFMMNSLPNETEPNFPKRSNSQITSPNPDSINTLNDTTKNN